MTDLIDTTVTLTWQFDDTDGRQHSERRYLLDNVVLNGVISEPSTYALLAGLTGIAFVALRRRV